MRPGPDLPDLASDDRGGGSTLTPAVRRGNGDGDDAPASTAWPYLVLALALLGIGIAAWRPIPAGVWHDDGVYMLIGKALSEGRGLVYSGVVGDPPAVKFPPLYPTLLAALWTLLGAIGPVTMAATLLNLAMLAGAGALFARALRVNTDLSTAACLAIAALGFASTDVLRAALVPLSESTFLLLTAICLALWRRCAEGDRHALALLAATMLAAVATRTAGAALVLSVAVSLATIRRPGAAIATSVPAVTFLVGWGAWSTRAASRINEGQRDLLGPYGRWLFDQTVSARESFVANLPGHAMGIVERASALTVPGVSGRWLWLVAALAIPPVLLGLRTLIRRLPPLGWFTVIYLAVLLLWPYLDRRLLVPWLPGLLAALAVGAMEAARRLPVGLGRLVLGLAVTWLIAYTSVTAGRIAEGWPTAPYRLRSDRLATSVEALSRTIPDDAVVGAPEFWAGLHLHGGWTVAPSTRFDPRNADPDVPMWGTPTQQLALWRSAGIDHLLLEQGGLLHEDSLNRLEAACPGSVFILARMPGSMVVRLAWDASCEAGA